MQMRFDLVIGKVIILCHPNPRLFIVVIFVVPNQKVHILTAVGDNLLPLVLKISFAWKDNTIVLQIIKQQVAQTDFPHTLPAGWIGLVAPA